MYLRRLELVQFRCYETLALDLTPSPIVFVGANAQGKTTLLEAAFVLATTRAPYGVLDRLLVRWSAADDVLPFSRVTGEVVRSDGVTTIDVLNIRASADPSDDRTSKRVRLDDTPRRAMDVLGTLNVVLFTPRDIDLIHGPPAERRRYLDVLLCQVDRGYARALGQYNHVLVQRNHLLRRLRDRGGDRAELAVWDDALVSHGARLLHRRAGAVRALDEHARVLHAELVGDAEILVVAYRSRVLDGPTGPSDVTATELEVPDEATIAARFAGLVAERREEEIARGASLVGPHRDDLALTLQGVDMRPYGSRGQQRTVTLALKLAEAEVMWRTTGERPVLLLDDVLSELDRNRRSRLLAHVGAHEQAWITTTDLDAIDPALLAHAVVYEVRGGTLRPGPV